jgi:hypothetical protein
VSQLDYYSVLGVEKNAAKAEIKSAYRELAMLLHPDKHGGSKAAVKRFRDVQTAYEVLIDDVKRAAYDAENSKNETASYDSYSARNYEYEPPRDDNSGLRSTKNTTGKGGTVKKVCFVIGVCLIVGIIAGNHNTRGNKAAADRKDVLSALAHELALKLNSRAFYGDDQTNGIKSYYFIPIAANELQTAKNQVLKLSSRKTIKQASAAFKNTDDGVVKARGGGYKANYGVLLVVENDVIMCKIGEVTGASNQNNYNHVQDRPIDTNSKKDVEDYLRKRGW